MDPDDPTQRIQLAMAGRTVCPEHFEDDFLREWIRDNSISCECAYCDRVSDRPVAAPADAVAELVWQGLERAWGDFDDELVPWGMGYDGFKTTIELLWEEEVTADSAVTDDLIRALPDRQWVQRDFFRLTPYQRLRGAWEGFVYSVKHESRYFFGLRKPDPDDPDDVPPLLLLSTLGGVIEEASLIRAWPAGTVIYRARPHAATETYTDAWDLSAVPMANAGRAAANRMSAAGVPMFYGSLSPDAAETETVSTLPGPPEAVTIAAFRLTRAFRMLDLSSGVDVPSLFDPDQGDRRAEFAFLRGFLQDAAQDVRRDGQEHIAYVPTQVVCEYFRSQFRTSDGRQLDGIAYSSLRLPGEVNVVLFVPNDAVANRDGSRPPRLESERWLGPLNLGPEPLLQLDSVDRRENSSDI